LGKRKASSYPGWQNSRKKRLISPAHGRLEQAEPEQEARTTMIVYAKEFFSFSAVRQDRGEPRIKIDGLATSRI
jgi:hypothetical protein